MPSAVHTALMGQSGSYASGERLVKVLGGRYQRPTAKPMDQYLSRLTAAILALLKQLQDTIPLAGLETELESRNPSKILAYLDLENRFHKYIHGAGVPVHGHSVSEIIRDVYINGAHAEIKALDKVPVRVRKQSVGT